MSFLRFGTASIFLTTCIHNPPATVNYQAEQRTCLIIAFQDFTKHHVFTIQMWSLLNRKTMNLWRSLKCILLHHSTIWAEATSFTVMKNLRSLSCWFPGAESSLRLRLTAIGSGPSICHAQETRPWKADQKLCETIRNVLWLLDAFQLQTSCVSLGSSRLQTFHRRSILHRCHCHGWSHHPGGLSRWMSDLKHVCVGLLSIFLSIFPSNLSMCFTCVLFVTPGTWTWG